MTCHLCGRNEFDVLRRKLRFEIARNVLKCRSCALVFLEPKSVDLPNYYAGDYRNRYTAVPGKAMSSKEIFDMYLPFQKDRIKEIESILRADAKVLDVGSSTGHFLNALAPYVRETVGIEFNRDNAAFSRSLGITTYTEPIENTDLSPASFDLITLFQILEHVEEPVKFLQSLGRYLKPNGHLVVEVPNLDDALLSIYNVRAFADFWFIEPHLYYFNTATLKKILEKAGFAGRIKSTQEYSLMNHLNWLLVGKPQASAKIGMDTPALAHGKTADMLTGRALNEWLQKTDDEYRRLLEEHGVGGKLLFIGQKSGNN